jgi:hypothetical protein
MGMSVHKLYCALEWDALRMHDLRLNSSAFDYFDAQSVVDISQSPELCQGFI